MKAKYFITKGLEIIKIEQDLYYILDLKSNKYKPYNYDFESEIEYTEQATITKIIDDALNIALQKRSISRHFDNSIPDLTKTIDDLFYYKNNYLNYV